MRLLDEIAGIAASSQVQAADLEQMRVVAETQDRELAASQRGNIARWYSEFLPQAENTSREISDALGGQSVGCYLHMHNRDDRRVLGNDVLNGPISHITYRVQLPEKPGPLITLGLEAVHGPDGVIFYVRSDRVRGTRLVVDDMFSATQVDYWFKRIVRDALLVAT